MAVGAVEILLILFFVLLVIGPRRITNLGRALGRGVRDFKLEFGRDKRDEELGDHEQPRGKVEEATRRNEE